MKRRLIVVGLSVIGVMVGVCTGLRLNAGAQTGTSTASPSIERAVSTVAPTPPPLWVPAASASDHEIEVVATLPAEDGRLGPNLRQRGDPYHRRQVVPFDPDTTAADIIQGMLVGGGIRPSNLADELVYLHPMLGEIGMNIEQRWAYRDQQRGFSVSDAPGRRMAQALVDGAPDTRQGVAARHNLLFYDVAAADPSQREQVQWEGVVALIRDRKFRASYLPEQLMGSAEISLDDHGVFAALPGDPPPFLADAFLRDALQRGDQTWTRFWWHHLVAYMDDERFVTLPYRPLLADNYATLAGSVGALLGEAATWEDGLRVAAVRCAGTLPARALDKRIVYLDGAWVTQQGDAPEAYAACVYRSASPAPPAGQRAHLRVLWPI